MNINTYRYKKSIIAWLLLVIFVFPIAIKAVHIYEHEYSQTCCHTETSDNDKKEKHDCDNCAICKYSFSVFTENEVLKTEIFTDLAVFLKLDYRQKAHNSTFSKPTLRAPPLLA